MVLALPLLALWAAAKLLPLWEDDLREDDLCEDSETRVPLPYHTSDAARQGKRILGVPQKDPFLTRSRIRR